MVVEARGVLHMRGIRCDVTGACCTKTMYSLISVFFWLQRTTQCFWRSAGQERQAGGHTLRHFACTLQESRDEPTTLAARHRRRTNRG